jgi:hypothetical protein
MRGLPHSIVNAEQRRLAGWIRANTQHDGVSFDQRQCLTHSLLFRSMPTTNTSDVDSTAARGLRMRRRVFNCGTWTAREALVRSTCSSDVSARTGSCRPTDPAEQLVDVLPPAIRQSGQANAVNDRHPGTTLRSMSHAFLPFHAPQCRSTKTRRTSDIRNYTYPLGYHNTIVELVRRQHGPSCHGRCSRP